VFNASKGRGVDGQGWQAYDNCPSMLFEDLECSVVGTAIDNDMLDLYVDAAYTIDAVEARTHKPRTIFHGRDNAQKRCMPGTWFGHNTPRRTVATLRDIHVSVALQKRRRKRDTGTWLKAR
jgi:hypothetical protein